MLLMKLVITIWWRRQVVASLEFLRRKLVTAAFCLPFYDYFIEVLLLNVEVYGRRLQVFVKLHHKVPFSYYKNDKDKKFGELGEAMVQLFFYISASTVCKVLNGKVNKILYIDIFQA